MSTTTLTTNDAAILARNWERQRRIAERNGTLHLGVMCPDNDYIDYRAMLAREQHRAAPNDGINDPYKPADVLRFSVRS